MSVRTRSCPRPWPLRPLSAAFPFLYVCVTGLGAARSSPLERELTARALDRSRYGVRFFASGFSKKWFLQPQSLVDLAAVTPGILQAFGVGGELLQGSRILRILRLLRLVR